MLAVSVDSKYVHLAWQHTLRNTGCPAKRRPGEETLKPDVEGAHPYFEKHYAE